MSKDSYLVAQSEAAKCIADQNDSPDMGNEVKLLRSMIAEAYGQQQYAFAATLIGILSTVLKGETQRRLSQGDLMSLADAQKYINSFVQACVDEFRTMDIDIAPTLDRISIRFLESRGSDSPTIKQEIEYAKRRLELS